MIEHKTKNFEIKFKIVCFIVATASLVFFFYQIFIGTVFKTILGTLGLFLVCIEMGVLMSYEQLSAKLSFHSIFKKQMMHLSAVGVFALTLGRIGTVLMLMPFLSDLAYLMVVSF